MLFCKIKSGQFVVWVAFLLLTSLPAAAQPPPGIDNDAPETVFTEEIKLNVSAFDLAGEFVSKVAKDDIVIVEDGRLHQPISIRRIPANVLIVLDTGE